MRRDRRRSRRCTCSRSADRRERGREPRGSAEPSIERLSSTVVDPQLPLGPGHESRTSKLLQRSKPEPPKALSPPPPPSRLVVAGSAVDAGWRRRRPRCGRRRTSRRRPRCRTSGWSRIFFGVRNSQATPRLRSTMSAKPAVFWQPGLAQPSVLTTEAVVKEAMSWLPGPPLIGRRGPGRRGRRRRRRRRRRRGRRRCRRSTMSVPPSPKSRRRRSGGCSSPSPPSTKSLPPSPATRSLPLSPKTRSAPPPPAMLSLPVEPRTVSRAGAAVDRGRCPRRRRSGRCRPRRRIRSLLPGCR